jgi:ribosomal protein L31E
MDKNGLVLIFSQLHGVSFKKRAPKAIKEIKAFAFKSMVRPAAPSIL